MVVRSLRGALSDLIGVEEEFAAQPVKGNGGLDGVQILALDVLDEGDFEQTVVGDFTITTGTD